MADCASGWVNVAWAGGGGSVWSMIASPKKKQWSKSAEIIGQISLFTIMSNYSSINVDHRAKIWTLKTFVYHWFGCLHRLGQQRFENAARANQL